MEMIQELPGFLNTAQEYLPQHLFLNVWEFLGGVLSMVLLWNIFVAFYRVTFHPLAKVPGPKLAGATGLYQLFYAFYQDRSTYFMKIEELHRKYGKFDARD